MKDFKGLVKISDVQNAFNEIINSMNDIIDTYNASARVLDIDYTKGSSELGASGYTLSVGGLKRIIKTYQGCSVGCKPFKIDNSHCKVTAGYVFANNTVYRTNEQDMTGSGSVLYYDIDNKRYTFGAGATTSTQVITLPAITSNVSWGNIYATSDNANAWYAPSMQASGLDIYPYKGWGVTDKAAGIGKQWKWTWSFPAKTSAHLKFFVYDAWGYTSANPWYFSAVSGSVSGVTQTHDDNNGWTQVECDINNATSFEIYGTFNKVGPLNMAMLVIFGMQLTNVTTQVIIGGDEETGQLVKICDLNWNRDSKQLLSIPKMMTESDNRSITIQGKSIPFNSSGGYTGNGDFCWATHGQYNGEVTIFGRNISYFSNTGGNTLHHCTMPTYLYIPSGVANPLSGAVVNTYTAKYSG